MSGPTCFVCRKEIERGEKVEVRRLPEGGEVFRHVACLPGENFDSKAEAAVWREEHDR